MPGCHSACTGGRPADRGGGSRSSSANSPTRGESGAARRGRSRDSGDPTSRVGAAAATAPDQGTQAPGVGAAQDGGLVAGSERGGGDERFGGSGGREQVALDEIAAGSPQVAELVGVADALGGDAHAEGVGEQYHGAHQAGVGVG